MLNGRRQPSHDGTSRMGESQVQICEELGVKSSGLLGILDTNPEARAALESATHPITEAPRCVLTVSANSGREQMQQNASAQAFAVLS
jgi:hypothetical protein